MPGRPFASTLLKALILAATVSAFGAGTAAAADPVDIKINFQKASALTPLGYTPDTGVAYNATNKRGWVRDDSLLSAMHKGYSFEGRGRDRGVTSSSDVRFRSFMLATSDKTAGPLVKGAWEVEVPPGTYDVEVGMGDSAADDSIYTANVENTPVILPFTPNTTTAPFAPFVKGTATVTVTDGRLTLSSPNPGIPAANENPKFSYITIKTGTPPPPPVAPTGLSATAGVGAVRLDWTANTETNLAGYRIYRSTTSPVPTGAGATPLNPALFTGTTYQDKAVTNDTRYFYAVTAVNGNGDEGPGSAEANAVPTAPPAGAVNLKVDFKPATTGKLAPGYVADVGQPYSETVADHQFGWVTQDSLATATHAPLDITNPTRMRYRVPAAGLVTDPRTDTTAQLMVQPPAFGPTAAWEAKVPVGGCFTVTVGAGDPAAFNSSYVVNVEGKQAINFTPAADGTGPRTVVGTVTTDPVTDGRLTIDGIGGTNVKLTYVDVVSVLCPGSQAGQLAPPTGFVATGDLAGVHLSWSPNLEDDLVGYYVYRSTQLPVPTDASATPLNGANPLTITAYDDTTPVPGTTYYYAITAANFGGARSIGSNPVTATQPIRAVDYKFSFQPSGTPTVGGYITDTGLAYGPKGPLKYGWVREDSLGDGLTHVPVAAGPARDRNVVADQSIDSFIHMQPAGGVRTAWDLVVPNGPYDVRVSVGDPLVSPSTHEINVEGQPVITDFFPTNDSKWRVSTASVTVTDGKLTIDAIGGDNTKLNYVWVKSSDPGTRPSVGDVAPYDGATNVSRNRSVTAEVNLPNLAAGVDKDTLNTDSVRIVRVSDGSTVPVKYNTSAAGDVLTLVPRAQLDKTTEYRFEVNSRLKDTSGASFIPKTTTFTTGVATSELPTIARFSKVTQTQGQGEMMTSLTIGPDHRLYVTTLDGKILRFPIDDATGNLGAPTTITSVIDHENGPRHILGLAFDPAATAENPILWVTSGSPEFVNAPDWTGKVSRLSGPDLSQVDDYVTGLPRSVRDHETNSLAFGPDGKLYVTQGSNSATGQTDQQWGQRPEHLLNAAVLRVDPSLITNGPVNVKTEGEDVNYDPFAPNAPVTLYATGIRNAYDLVWHSNGQLYVPTNGSAANGNTPSSPDPLPAACSKRIDSGTAGPYTGPAVVGQQKLLVQPDLLFRVQQGGYYGHPNPSRCEYVFFGGNPTSGPDPLETFKYDVGTQPDRNWRLPAWNFGNHFSPNGAIEYRSSKFGGALDGALLVTRYSDGDDIVAMPIGADLNPSNSIDGIAGFGGLDNPLDITEDYGNGNLYVTELSEDKAPQITLIKPDETAGAPQATPSPTRVVKSAVVGRPSSGQSITIRNTGNAPLRVNSLTLGGADASQFTIDVMPTIPQQVNPDQEVQLDVQFTPTSVGVKDATLSIGTDDPAGTRTVSLRGLGTAEEGGANEPSLQRILDTFQIPVNVGDDNADETYLPAGLSLGQEVPFQSLRKAGPGKVTIEPLASFGKPSDAGTNMAAFGWNEFGNASPDDATTLSSIPNTAAQTVAPKTTGALSFDPDTASFGLWAAWNASSFNSRISFSQDTLNNWGGTGTHQVRAYPLRDAGGVVPGAYVVAFEDVAGAGVPLDYNDLVYVIRNVQPEGSGDGRLTLTNLDGAPFDDRLVFNRIGSLASPPRWVVHDRSTLQVKNTGTTPLTITDLPMFGNFTLASITTFPTANATTGTTIPAPIGGPVTLQPGFRMNITVRFIAEAGRVSSGHMTIVNTSALSPAVNVDLAGYWQPEKEGSYEPKLSELVTDVMGFGTKILKTGQIINGHGKVETAGDEILSPYWRQADPSKTSKVTQLSAFHTYGDTAQISWFMKGSGVKGATNANPNNSQQILYHSSTDGQSVIPHLGNSTTQFASATFSPTAEFGFSIGGEEKSDPTLNDATGDVTGGCIPATQCGHHVRAWPAKNRAGQIIPNTYLITMDYASGGGNYDYNDNLYLVTNIQPALNDRPLLYRIDVGSTVPYTDPSGNVWAADTTAPVSFTPSDAVAEGNTTDPIANTTADPMFSTYRGNVGNVPQAQRTLKYTFPTRTATKVDVRLYFAEKYWNAANQRVFDVYANGEKKLTGIDIFSLTNKFWATPINRAASGNKTAYSKAINGIPVNGSLELAFQATKDYASVAGIEVFCAEKCGSD